MNSLGTAVVALARSVGARLTPELLLRFSLAVIYFWFGTLKLVGLSPVLELVRNTYPAMATVPLYIGLALFEVMVGVALLSGIWMRVLTAAIILHLLGTFGVLVSSPQTAFLPQFPFLTLEGEFVVKNLVLLAAAVALFLHYTPQRPILLQWQAARVWWLAGFLGLSMLLGFAAVRVHQSLRVAARTSVTAQLPPVEITAAAISVLVGSVSKRPIQIEGVMVDRCPILGCWLKLRDRSGDLFVDLAPEQLSARGIPLGIKLRIAGSIGKTRDGQVGFVASSIHSGEQRELVRERIKIDSTPAR